MKDNLFEQLSRHEGYRSIPYKCTKDKWTVGIGRNLEDNPLSKSEIRYIMGDKATPVVSLDVLLDYIREFPLTSDQIYLLYQNDIDHIIKSVDYVDLNKHDPARASVIINMAFQMGVEGVRDFSQTIKYFNEQDYESCSVEMLDSKWARKDTPNRAAELSRQMKTGVWS